MEPDYFYLINPGSVGQPRDGDPRAAYALYSPENHTVEYGRVPYDIGKAAAKIRAAGPVAGDGSRSAWILQALNRFAYNGKP